jgi:23S rRNA (cytidine1920-2'-O)/16S rRNA (cytidine1409-2'-O)-methyltransferase
MCCWCNADWPKAASRRRLIRAGAVTAEGQTETKPSRLVAAATTLAVKTPPRFVSRGGAKLEGAFAAFGLSVTGQLCLDIGASTGGFTDCLLQHGALKVYAVDVGKGQLHWKLRNDPRVVVVEGVNARYLVKTHVPDPVAFACVDVAFISLTQILPAVIGVLDKSASLVTLIKPQFEAGRNQVAKGGVVRDPAVRAEVVERIRAFGVGTLGLQWLGVCESPLEGPAGNVEFLAWWGFGGKR